MQATIYFDTPGANYDVDGASLAEGDAGISPPGPPLSVLATPGNESATLSWTPPTDTGGGPLTDYTVTADPGGSNIAIAASSSDATFPDLTDGVSYTFTVSASNSSGAGPDSSPSNEVTPEVLLVTTASLPGGTLKAAYSTSLSASGGNPPYRWSVASGSSRLPPGLKLKPTGVISGKPKTAGTYSFTVQVVDTKTKTKPKTQNEATATLSITIT
jgi:hypothetical protein